VVDKKKAQRRCQGRAGEAVSDWGLTDWCLLGVIEEKACCAFCEPNAIPVAELGENAPECEGAAVVCGCRVDAALDSFLNKEAWLSFW